LPDYCRVPYTCILKLCLLTGYIKPSAAVLRARELAKLALKRGAFDQWAERLREIIA
jgi:hypothetical protein